MIPFYTPERFTSAFLNRKKKNSQREQEVLVTAKRILDDIRENGDEALKKYVQQFDGTVPSNWEVTKEERKQAWDDVDPKTIAALQKAADNIRQFHQKQLPTSRTMELSDQIQSGQLYRPIERVGIYVPGGTASYPSTVLMNAIPAVLAGVQDVIMVSPARNGQPIKSVLLVAADIAGVQTIYKLGGVQAIAALAYGTETIEPVDKIVGPGNAYVAAAKSLVFGEVGIDMIAGPSEVAIIADETADPIFVAADLIAQAEHDKNARAFLFTNSPFLAEATKAELAKQCATLPRESIATAALEQHGATVQVNSIDQAFELVNKLAPEHLEIQLQDPMTYLGKVRNAGSVFLGSYTPEALGDYYAGPNHVLPTSGTAKFSSGLSVDDFLTKTTYLYYGKSALVEAAPHVTRIAEEEELSGHARAVQKRIDKRE
ncbi:histidinol dehydrogenase [Aquibacillus sp. 3ASR75-11]|uniref:Histidinol dehydrogenase n=1 Tax=Terrihalobacillus insolitus TaxID=2950438 RepID=A0A9X3WXS4_9BACI|nr:histidinol dehydrogenase [Terrihalobacillus insolitus]MDC3426211.1 histidinol dehydrogenase [Terrihalobacillus insolitus]